MCSTLDYYFLFLCSTFNSQDADLAKVASITQNHKLCDPIISHHCQFSFLDDVHFSADVALLTDVISRTVDLRLKLQHQLHQQAGLAVCKYSNLQDDRKEEVLDPGSYIQLNFGKKIIL